MFAKMQWEDRKELAKRTVIEFFQESSMMHGAALSYYFMLALIPMLYLSTNYLGHFFGEDQVREVVTQLLQEWIGIQDVTSLIGFLEQVNFDKSSLFLQIVGVIALLYSCSAIFNSLRMSLNEFYDIDSTEITRRKLIFRSILARFISFGFVIGGSLILLVLYFTTSLILSFVTNLLSDMSILNMWVGEIINIGLPIFSNLIVFWFVFKYMHDGNVSSKAAFRGSVVTSLMLYVGQLLIKYYLTNYFFGAHGGVAGSILIILVWVYYSSQIIFLGAKYITVYSRFIGKPIKHVMKHD